MDEFEFALTTFLGLIFGTVAIDVSQPSPARQILTVED